MSDEDRPLPSTPAEETPEEVADDRALAAAEEEAEPTPARPTAPRPTFKISTFVYVFLGLLGMYMLFDPTFRNSIAGALGTSPSSSGPLYTLIGFDSQYLLLTMALAGAIEMLVTSLAYNYTTDWIKAAKVQKWSAAFRKVQMDAIRSGKKDRIAALKPHQERLTRLSSEVSIAQFKGMAITYFLLILIYTWVGLVIGDATVFQRTVSLGGTIVDLTTNIPGLPIPWWFAIFSLYTVPTSLVFRRILKHLWLHRYAEKHALSPPPASGTTGSSAS